VYKSLGVAAQDLVSALVVLSARAWSAGWGWRRNLIRFGACMFRRKGTIVEWNDDRGFGYIAPAKGGERVFCHVKSFPQPGAATGPRPGVHIPLGERHGRTPAGALDPTVDASLRSPDPSVRPSLPAARAGSPLASAAWG
jgi:hypothetical protein